MKINIRMVGYGALIWLIMFIIGSLAFPLMELYFLFYKTLMVITGAITASIVTVLYFKKVDCNYLKEGIILGIILIVMSWVLDMLFLLPILGQPIWQYMLETGLEYAVTPVITIMAGYLLEHKGRA